jgi:hypothetical protein
MERHLQCPICQDIFRQAVEVNCCTKCFCRECISEHVRLAAQPTCPNCRKPLAPGDWKENKPLQQLVSDLPIECKYKENGVRRDLALSIEYRILNMITLYHMPFEIFFAFTRFKNHFRSFAKQ